LEIQQESQNEIKDYKNNSKNEEEEKGNCTRKRS
jgi:hypothetical protein